MSCKCLNVSQNDQNSAIVNNTIMDASALPYEQDQGQLSKLGPHKSCMPADALKHPAPLQLGDYSVTTMASEDDKRTQKSVTSGDSTASSLRWTQAT